MKKWVVLMVCLISPTTLGQTSQASAQSPAAPVASPADTAPLSLVIAQVKAALDEYQKNLGSGADALPPLSSAEFEFKTTTATIEGLTINLFIFKLGGSHESDVINDVTYAYSVPKPPKPPVGLLSKRKPPLLQDALAQTIQSAATAIKTSGTVGKLTFSKLTVNLQYGVKWDGNIAANVPIQLVTIGLSGEKNKNTVQSVKLVFGQ